VKEQLILLALQQTPAVITLIRELFVKQHPEAPVPSDAEVIAAWTTAFVSSLAKDDAWLASHPA
jgi:hypothetical protein